MSCRSTSSSSPRSRSCASTARPTSGSSAVPRASASRWCAWPTSRTRRSFDEPPRSIIGHTGPGTLPDHRVLPPGRGVSDASRGAASLGSQGRSGLAQMGTSTLRSPGIPDSQWIRVSPWRMGFPAGPPSVADFPLVLLMVAGLLARGRPASLLAPGPGAGAWGRGPGAPPLWRQTPGAWGLTTWLWFVIHLAPEHILYCPMHHPVPARDRA